MKSIRSPLAVRLRQLQILAPIAGIIAFLVLYAIAALNYPGGIKTDPTTVGFSLTRNYWCDLLDATAYNGQPNPARPIGIVATLLLSVAFSVLFWQLPAFLGANERNRLMRWVGIGGLMAGACIFTPWHGQALALGGVLLGIALLILMYELWRVGLKRVFWAGIGCLAIGGLCYFMYYTSWQLSALALTQKFSFLAFFVWVSWINWVFYRSHR
jgi:hypothetical protein